MKINKKAQKDVIMSTLTNLKIISDSTECLKVAVALEIAHIKTLLSQSGLSQSDETYHYRARISHLESLMTDVNTVPTTDTCTKSKKLIAVIDTSRLCTKHKRDLSMIDKECLK